MCRSQGGGTREACWPSIGRHQLRVDGACGFWLGAVLDV
jgi:hypothetical protein